VEKQRGALRLTAVNPAAHILGMAPGLALADARARVPDLAAYDADDQADAALLERLAQSCLRYTPRVEIDPPQGLLLDITGCVHLFDANLDRGEIQLAADLLQRLTCAGYSATYALSASADAAMALAVHGLNEGQVAQLPVSALRCDPAIHHALRRAGLTHIRDLASRPRTMLAARFGEETTRLLARLLGEVDTPIIARRMVSAIEVEARFAEPVGHLDSIRAVLAALANDAVVQLCEQGLGARKVGVTLFRCDGQARSIGIETAAPTRDPALIMRLFAERIEALNDPLDPGFGYDHIVLTIAAAEPQMAEQHDFDRSAAQAHEELAALLARLATRLGPDRVTCWQMVDSHVPEGVFVDVAVLSSPQRKAEPTLRPLALDPLSGTREDYAPTRPVLLLDPPQRIEAIAQVPDGPPYRFAWRGVQHRVARHEGPERIAMPWWQGKGPKGNAARLSRDYYRVEDVEGRRFWLFRHGLYSEKTDPNWYVHGLFA
jgi:protein ImuB